MRAYYIANAYDGAYFYVGKEPTEYAQKLTAYLSNLVNSSKTNHYSIGSMEITEAEYENLKTDATSLESSQIKSKQEDQEEEKTLKRPNLKLV